MARLNQFESGELVCNLRLKVASLRAAEKVASEELAARDNQLKTLGASLARSEEARDAAEVRRAVALQQQAVAHRKVRDEKEKEWARQVAALKAQIAVLETAEKRFEHDLTLIVDIRNNEVAEAQRLRTALSRAAETVKETQLREAVCTTALNKIRRELGDGCAVDDAVGAVGAVATSAASVLAASSHASSQAAGSTAFRHAASRIGPNLVPIHDTINATGLTLTSCAEECFATCNTSRRLIGMCGIVVRGERSSEFEKKFKELPLAVKARELQFCVRKIMAPHCGWLTANVLQYKRLFIKMQCELHLLGTSLRTGHYANAAANAAAHVAATKLDEIMECARDALPTFGDALLPAPGDLDDHRRDGVSSSATGEQ